jgi:hypothetical protein
LPADGWVNVFPNTTRIGAHCYATVLVIMVYCLKPITTATNCRLYSNDFLKEIRKVTRFGLMSAVTAA